MASYHQASPQSGMMAHHRLPPGPLQANGAPAQHRPAGAPPPPGNLPPSNTLDRLTSLNEVSWIQIGRAAEQIGNNETAIFSYERALRFNQYSLDALHSIASVLRSEDKYDQAIQYLKTILHLDSTNGESWSNLGHCYLMMDELQEAYQAYQSALYNLRDPKEPKLWYGIGILYDRYGSLDHAEEAFSQVMRMAPDFDKATEIYFRLGIIYKQQAKFDQSLECFRWIADKPPQPLNRTDIWFQIGHVHEQQKDYAAAKDAYRRVLQNDPKHAKVLQQLGWLHHQESNDYHSQEKAIEYLEQSVNSDQTDAQSWYLLGRCYMSQQKFPKAYEAYQQAVYRDGRNPTFWCSIGVLYYQINQYRDALDAYSRAIRLNPNISEVWYDLGTLYESCNNQTSDALDAYQRAAELDPSNQHIKARLQYLRSGQGSGHPTQNGQPVDVHPQAYQPASVHGPPQPQWSAPGQPQAPAQQPAPPPLSGSRDWPQRSEHMHGAPPSQSQPSIPYEARDASRTLQASLHRQQSPRSEHVRPNDNSRHPPIRRPPSPSPRMRNALPQMYGASPAPSHAPSAAGPSQAQPPPSRISNPNYGQPLPPDPSQAQPAPSLQGPLPPYRASSPPAEVKPIVESRPRSPRASGYPQHTPQHSGYQHHAEPSAPSLSQGGYPAPSSAVTATSEAAGRDRGERNTPSSATSKRVREWEDRDEGHNKKPASDETRARLDDPSMRRPTPPAQGFSERERERDRERDSGRLAITTGGSTVSMPGSTSPEAIRHAEDQRRANETYMPSQVAHQPQPLSTTMQQEGYQIPPPSTSDAVNNSSGASSLPAGLASAASVNPAPNNEQIRQENPSNGEVPKGGGSARRLSEQSEKDGDARMRTEEPAARKIVVDENYDDDSMEDAKNKETNGTNSGGASLANSERASPRTTIASVQNGGPTKIEA